MKVNKAFSYFTMTLCAALSLLIPVESFAYESMKHYKTIESKMKDYSDGSRYRAGVLTIGRKYYDDGTNMGRIQLRLFSDTDSIKNIYWTAYPITMLTEVYADDGEERTGDVLTWAPLSSNGSTVTLSDVVFNWKDWTNIVGLAVKVATNRITSVIDVERPNTSVVRVIANRPNGLSNVDLPSNIATKDADRLVQDKHLGFTSEFVVKLDDEFSKIRSRGRVKYHVYDNSQYAWIDVWGESAYNYHYLW